MPANDLFMVEAQQAARFIDEEFEIAKGLSADILPANFSSAIHKEGAMERHLFEIIVGAIGFERLERMV
jgi:hypothetical protein